MKKIVSEKTVSEPVFKKMKNAFSMLYCILDDESLSEPPLQLMKPLRKTDGERNIIYRVDLQLSVYDTTPEYNIVRENPPKNGNVSSHIYHSTGIACQCQTYCRVEIILDIYNCNHVTSFLNFLYKYSKKSGKFWHRSASFLSQNVKQVTTKIGCTQRSKGTTAQHV